MFSYYIDSDEESLGFRYLNPARRHRLGYEVITKPRKCFSGPLLHAIAGNIFGKRNKNIPPPSPQRLVNL